MKAKPRNSVCHLTACLIAIFCLWPSVIHAQELASLKTTAKTLSEARIDLSFKNKRKLDAAMAVAGKIPYAGQALSALTGMAFTAPDAQDLVDDLRKEMLSYIDVKERELLDATLKSYPTRLESWAKHRTPADDKIDILETIHHDLITAISADFDVWRKRHPETVKLYAAIARLHLDVIEILCYLDMDPTSRDHWRDEYSTFQATYVKNTRESVERLVAQRLSEIEAPTTIENTTMRRGFNGDPILMPNGTTKSYWSDRTIKSAKAYDDGYNLALDALLPAANRHSQGSYEWKNHPNGAKHHHDEHADRVWEMETLQWQSLLVDQLEAPRRTSLRLPRKQLDILAAGATGHDNAKARSVINLLNRLEPDDPLFASSFFEGNAIKPKITNELLAYKLSYKGPSYRMYNTVGMTMIIIDKPDPKDMPRMPEYAEHEGANGQTVRIKINYPPLPAEAYRIGMTEVTVDQWNLVMDDAKSMENSLVTHPEDKAAGLLPIARISWEEAQIFCKKLSEREGLTYRLPTEAEWEYACRAGTYYRWESDNYSDDLDDYAWYTKTAGVLSKGPLGTRPVATKKPSRWGLYDMYGNVKEWCQDTYHSQTDDGNLRIVRGGGWRSDTDLVNSLASDQYDKTRQIADIGLRVVLEVSR